MVRNQGGEPDCTLTVWKCITVEVVNQDSSAQRIKGALMRSFLILITIDLKSAHRCYQKDDLAPQDGAKQGITRFSNVNWQN